jgi:hypothetical protein
MKGVAMRTVTALWTGAVLTLSLFSIGSVYAEEAKDSAITEKSFGCILEGTKVGNAYFRNQDPEKLKEAIRIFKDNVPDTIYPVGTILQLFPNQAMVKHTPEKFPLTNGWEFLGFQLSEHGTIILSRGARASDHNSVPCIACHQAAEKFDFVCGKGRGCAPLAADDKKIAQLQAADPRCPKK